ncbi:MAG: PadR family transcriptional regulator [Clostridia bacterium]|nr:PadR family transcriptional regulator [Clostridia bacterium]
MGNKRIEVVSESMFYTLMAFLNGEYSGTEIASMVEKLTKGRVRLGPATLYTILGRFEEEKVIEETRTDGRKRFYHLTDKGAQMYHDELERLKQCITDAIVWEDKNNETLL